ncbi:transcription factor of the MADS box [Coemansia sp. IMI 203386]|nr:transcription factor of the MADS box [Coemansia sp. IMI 203386]
MYGYEPKALGYPDNLSISSTETAAPIHQSSSSAALSAQSLFKMNSAFIPDDSSRLGAYASVDAAAAGAPLLDHPHSHSQQQQQQPAARFSAASESRNQTPAAKRTREDEESEGNESENNSRGANESSTAEKRAGRRKIKIEYIEDKSRRHITFSKRKAGIMKKAYELSTLTGTQVLLLVVSETGLVYTFTTPKLQPIVTQPEGKNLIQACLNVPDTPGERVAQPIPTESNSYMSQPRQSQAQSQSHSYSSGTGSAAAAAAAAAVMGTGASAVGHDLHHGLAEDHKANDDSPAMAAANAAAPASYLQYPYGQSAVAQAAAAVAVAAASAGTPGAYAPGMVSQTAANGAVSYGAVPGYTSYPGSTSQSQHHSPITGAISHTSHSAGGANGNANGSGISAAAVAAASIPGMNSLNSYHHGYSHPQQQQASSHYAYHHQQQQHHHHQTQQHQHQHQYHGHQSHAQHQAQASAPSTPLESNPSASAAAVAAAVAAAAGNQAAPTAAGNITTSYMAANHYWSPSAITSPHPAQQQAQQPTSATGLVQRTGYAGGN